MKSLMNNVRVTSKRQPMLCIEVPGSKKYQFLKGWTKDTTESWKSEEMANVNF